MSDLEEKAPKESLGAYLKRVRESKGLSLEELSQRTRVALGYLQEIEAGNWKKFPIEAYARAYLNSVSEVLGLNPAEILANYSREAGSSYSQEFISADSISSGSELFSGGRPKPEGKRSKFLPVILVVLLLAVLAAMYFMKSSQPQEVFVEPPAAESESDEDTTSFSAEVPDGAESVSPESLSVGQDTSAMSVALDSARKVAAKGSSATTFITSSDSKGLEEDSVATQIRVTVVGNDSAVSWVGIYRSLNDNKVLREANISSPRSKISYTYNDTLCLVIGNPDAVGAMIVNDKKLKVPVRKGYSSRFCIAPNGKFTRR